MKHFIKRFFQFSLFILLITAIIEITLRATDAPKMSHFSILPKSFELIPQIDENTVLILGDSRLEFGLKPEMMRSILKDEDVKVVNMAFPGSNGIDILKYLKSKSIYPRFVIMGYTPNYGRYDNHGIDQQQFSKVNEWLENIKYMLKQEFYLFDRASLRCLIKEPETYWISHDYDEWGGVQVIAEGNYNDRLDHQIDLYESWMKGFSSARLDGYYNELRDLKSFFSKQGTKILGLYMPVCDEVFAYEKELYKAHKPDREVFTFYLDYSNLVYQNNVQQPDSVYFYDGSHLSDSFSEDFTILLSESISVVL